MSEVMEEEFKRLTTRRKPALAVCASRVMTRCWAFSSGAQATRSFGAGCRVFGPGGLADQASAIRSTARLSSSSGLA